MRKLMAKADQGDKQALDTLRPMLNYDGSVWEEVGDLAAAAQEALIEVASGQQRLFVQETIRRKCATLAQELAGSTPTPLEKLLVERIVLSWLHLHYVESIYAQNLATIPLRHEPFYQHRISKAQARYLSAIRTLAQVRRLQAPAVQVNIAEQQLNVAAITASPQVGAPGVSAGKCTVSIFMGLLEPLMRCPELIIRRLVISTKSEQVLG